jgi:dihydropteroate synthase
MEMQSILEANESQNRTLRLAGGRELELGRRPLIMGILNVTPDSFSDGGKYTDPSLAAEHAWTMREEGADIIDVGGASSRPGSEMVDEDGELKRVLPVIDRLVRERFIVSVDTFRSKVARACLERGVHIINDIGRLQLDAGLLPVLTEHQSPVVLMHNRMQFKQNEPYQDLISDILIELQESIDQALQGGLTREQIVVDPGIGFGKNAAQNRFIIKHLAEFKSLGYPVLLGASRKRFIGQTLDLEVEDRLEGSLAVAAMAVMNGADIIRVHDVKASRRIADMTWAVMQTDQSDQRDGSPDRS